MAARQIGVNVERGPPGTSMFDVLDRLLDKGIIIEGWRRVPPSGIDLVTVDARVVVASLEIYLNHTARRTPRELTMKQPTGSSSTVAQPPDLLSASRVDAAHPASRTGFRQPWVLDSLSMELPTTRPPEMHGEAGTTFKRIARARARAVVYRIRFGSPEIRAAADDPMLRKTVESLAVEPRPPMAMRAGKEGRCELWRLRIDDARVLYQIDARLRTVTIVAIKHRREPYSV
jgi:mRNA-degrading endonuclease RelE of RelBE toxin-antitoxin system